MRDESEKGREEGMIRGEEKESTTEKQGTYMYVHTYCTHNVQDTYRCYEHVLQGGGGHLGTSPSEIEDCTLTSLARLC